MGAGDAADPLVASEPGQVETAHVWPAMVSSCQVCVIIEFLAFLISIFSENVRNTPKNKQPESGELERNS